jgi:pimeloyl-ACP methyl ester carboxylesterase
LQYTLYPQALVSRMVSEVGAALTWALDHAAALGGDPQGVVLMGHSAGAQMAAMALLHRAAGARTAGHAQPPAVAARGDNGAIGAAGGSGSSSRSRGQASLAVAAEAAAAAAVVAAAGEEVGASSGSSDARMPCLLVGMAGVYDLAKHYEYEQRECAVLCCAVMCMRGWDLCAAMCCDMCGGMRCAVLCCTEL